LYSQVFSLYQEPYPLDAQTGLASTWLTLSDWKDQVGDNDACFCKPDGGFKEDNCCATEDKCAGLSNSIEGGPGYWRDTLPTSRVKYRLGASAGCYSSYARTLGWDPTVHHCDRMSMAQISNRLMVPPDGISFKVEGLLGWGWVNAPIGKLSKSDSRNFWTLVMDAKDFSGPVAYILPEFWEDREEGWRSESSGLPDFGTVAGMNLGETAFELHGFQIFKGKDGSYKIPKLAFPYKNGRAVLGGWHKAYKPEHVAEPLEKALAEGALDTDKLMAGIEGSVWYVDQYSAEPRKEPANFKMPDGKTYVFGEYTTSIEHGQPVWSLKIPECFGDGGGDTCQLPQYISEDMKGMHEADAPQDLRNSPSFPEKTESQFGPHGPRGDGDKFDARGTDYGTCVHEPGPALDTLFCRQTLSPSWIAWKWYKFIDQPGLQRLKLTDEQKEFMQSRVEKLHEMAGQQSQWIKREAGVEEAGIAQFDPAALVEPPEGLEKGYVPVILYEGLARPSGCDGEDDTPAPKPVTPAPGPAPKPSSCSRVENSDLGWTGKEHATHDVGDWKACCKICRGQASDDPPCIGWVHLEDGTCYQKYDMGAGVQLLPGNKGKSAGILSAQSKTLECGMKEHSNVGWTGKEDVRFGVAGWEACCDVCRQQASRDEPCVGWVFSGDGACWQKYNTGMPISLLDGGSMTAGILSGSGVHLG